jgi:hypothetical protein
VPHVPSAPTPDNRREYWRRRSALRSRLRKAEDLARAGDLVEARCPLADLPAPHFKADHLLDTANGPTLALIAELTRRRTFVTVADRNPPVRHSKSPDTILIRELARLRTSLPYRDAHWLRDAVSRLLVFMALVPDPGTQRPAIERVLRGEQETLNG